MYDTYGEHEEQMKVGLCLLRHYTVGQSVPIGDGIYLGYDRAIVINAGIFMCDLPIDRIFSKWGAPLKADIHAMNPIILRVKESAAKERNEDDEPRHH